MSRYKYSSKGSQVSGLRSQPVCLVPLPWGSWVGSQAPLSSSMVQFEPCPFGPCFPIPLAPNFKAREKLPLPESISLPGRSGGNQMEPVMSGVTKKRAWGSMGEAKTSEAKPSTHNPEGCFSLLQWV